MSLLYELGLLKPFAVREHDTVMNIVLTGTLLTKECQRVLKPFHLTEAQFNILMLLKYQSENGKINQTNIGSILLVNRSDITGLVDRMEKAGLVRRTADPGDRRVKYIQMTAEGMSIFQKANKAYIKRVKEIMSVFSDTECEKLMKLLEMIRKKFSRF